MKILIDLNVILDVVQRREPHYDASARLLSEARRGQFEALVPGHAITTTFYIIAKHASRDRAGDVVDWLLDHFTVASPQAEEFRRARALAIDDFEDAVVAVLANRDACDYIATRNRSDFENSPIASVQPSVLLAILTDEP